MFSPLNFNVFFFSFLAWCLLGIPVPGGLYPIQPSGCCPYIPKTQAECLCWIFCKKHHFLPAFLSQGVYYWAATGSLLISFPTCTDSGVQRPSLGHCWIFMLSLVSQTEWVCNMFFYIANEVLNVNSSWLYQHSLHI